MPMTEQQSTTRLDLPYIMPGQALKYITHNEALRALDIRVQTQIESRSVTAPPVDAENGDGYIIPNPAGEWPEASGTIMSYQDGAFVAYPPHMGWLVWVADEAVFVHYDGTGWRVLEMGGGGSGDMPDAVDTLGINASADINNRLSVSAPSTLLSHEGADHRLALNKAAATDTASVVFQTNYSGRAEFGLTGGDAFGLKVSPNGADFNEVFTVEPDTANMVIPDGRQFRFAVESSGKSGINQIGIRRGNLQFTKLSSDTSLSGGAAFVYEFCGGQNSGNPFWQGLQLACTGVRLNGSTKYPRTSLFWSYTDKDDPDDLAFTFQNSAGGLDADIKFVPAGDGEFIADTQKGMRVGPENTPVQAMLDVQGAIRVKTYTTAGLPTGQGVGAIIMVSDADGGLAAAYYDGSDWRTMHDRAVV